MFYVTDKYFAYDSIDLNKFDSTSLKFLFPLNFFKIKKDTHYLQGWK